MHLRQHLGRRLSATVLAVSYAIPIFGIPTATAATNLVPPAARCGPGQLRITPLSSTGGVGHIGILFRLHNTSSAACTLYGYPGIQLLNAHGRAMATHVQRGQGYLGGNQPRRLVHLDATHNGFFLMEWSHVPTGNQPCPVAHGVRIIPPNDFSAITLQLNNQYAIDACGGGLIVSPVEPKRFAG